MINKDEDDKKPEPKKEDVMVDVANMGVYCHLIIKDADTGQVIVNKRG